MKTPPRVYSLCPPRSPPQAPPALNRAGSFGSGRAVRLPFHSRCIGVRPQVYSGCGVVEPALRGIAGAHAGGAGDRCPRRGFVVARSCGHLACGRCAVSARSRLRPLGWSRPLSPWALRRLRLSLGLPVSSRPALPSVRVLVRARVRPVPSFWSRPGFGPLLCAVGVPVLVFVGLCALVGLLVVGALWLSVLAA